MSGFFSLDDDEDAGVGPSDRGSQIREGLSTQSPSSRSDSRSITGQQGRNTNNASSNPFYAILDREASGSSTREVGITSGADNGEERIGESRSPSEPPIMQLQRAWISERAAPEILPWKGNAVDDVCSQIEEQMTIVESLASDASTAEEEHVRLGLVELDVERARWLLKSYLRCRLDKIEEHATFLQQDHKSRQRMSDMEKGYCVKFTQIQSLHYHHSVLDFLPANLRSLDDKAESGSSGRGDMVTRPDLHRPVFIRCLEDCGSFTFHGHEDVVAFSKGSIHFVRYNTVIQLIERGQVEIL